jgi:hypothetical protein
MHSPATRRRGSAAVRTTATAFAWLSAHSGHTIARYTTARSMYSTWAVWRVAEAR